MKEELHVRVGQVSYQFHTPIIINDYHTIAGPLEKQGALTSYIDTFIDDLYGSEKTYENCYKKLICDGISPLIKKHPDVRLLFTGDLLNQSTPTHLALANGALTPITFDHACANFGLSLLYSALSIESQQQPAVFAGTMSHFAAVEKQFRFPNEYGQQKTPSSQTTVTGGGFCLLSSNGTGPLITGGTLGAVIDEGFSDPYNMGEAMAPACFHTLLTHFKDFNTTPKDYDYIITGDLGSVGQNILFDLLREENYHVNRNQLIDAGCEIYNKNQPVFSGGSGAGCLSLFLLSKGLKAYFKKPTRALVVATGALHSPLSLLQTPHIPTIAHLIVLESQ